MSRGWRVVAAIACLALPSAPVHATPSSDGCILAAYPRPDDAAALAVAGGEPVTDLHLTLVNLGVEANQGAEAELPRRLADLTASPAAPISAQVFGHAVINPNTADFNPSVVYLVGDSPGLVPLRQQVMTLAEQLYRLPAQHEPWLPHITATYGRSDTGLTYTGTVVFDRVGLKCGDRTAYFALGG